MVLGNIKLEKKVHDILILTTYAQMPLMNVYADLLVV